MRVLIIALAVATSVSPAIAQPEARMVVARDVAVDRIEIEISDYATDYAALDGPKHRPAMDRCATLLRWGGCEGRDRRRRYRADHQLHARLGNRARPLVLSREAVGAMGGWRGPRGPPLTKTSRGEKNFFRRCFSREIDSPDSSIRQLRSLAHARQHYYGRIGLKNPSHTPRGSSDHGRFGRLAPRQRAPPSTVPTHGRDYTTPQRDTRQRPPNDFLPVVANRARDRVTAP